MVIVGKFSTWMYFNVIGVKMSFCSYIGVNSEQLMINRIAIDKLKALMEKSKVTHKFRELNSMFESLRT